MGLDISYYTNHAEANMPRAVRFDPDARVFYPFRVTENGTTLPLIVDCASLKEAVEGAKVRCFHKEHLLIREIGRHIDKLHLFSIKKKATPRYVHKDHVTRAVHDLYAAPVCTIDAAVTFTIQPRDD